MSFDAEPFSQGNKWDSARIRSLQKQYSVESPIQYDLPVRIDGTAGNAFAVSPDQTSIIRVTQFQPDDGRLGSSAILAEIQRQDPQVCEATPKIINIGKAVVNETQGRLVELKPTSSQEGKLATTVEFFKPSDGWDITPTPFKHTPDGILKMILRQPEAIIATQLDFDCRTHLAAIHKVTRLQSSLSDHGVILRDYKGSYAIKSDNQGHVTEMKVLDIDQIETRFDNDTRDKVAIGDMLGFGFGLSVNDPMVENLVDAIQVNSEIMTENTKRMLQVDYLMWLTATPDDKLRAAGITDKKITLRELLALTEKYLSDTEPIQFDTTHHIQQRKNLRNARNGVTREVSSTPNDLLDQQQKTVEAQGTEVHSVKLQDILQSNFGISPKTADEVQQDLELEQFDNVQTAIQSESGNIPPQIHWFLNQYNSMNRPFHNALWEVRSSISRKPIYPPHIFKDLLYTIAQNTETGQIVTQEMAEELKVFGQALREKGVTEMPNIIRRASEAADPFELFKIQEIDNPHYKFRTPIYRS